MFNTGGYYGCGGCPVGEDTVLSSCSILVATVVVEASLGEVGEE